jgi:hypothetical protein
MTLSSRARYRKAGTYLGVGAPTPIPTPFGGRLTSFSPTSGYSTLDLYWYVSLIHAVHNGVHTFDHRLLQPGPCVRRRWYRQAISCDSVRSTCRPGKRSDVTYQKVLPAWLRRQPR